MVSYGASKVGYDLGYRLGRKYGPKVVNYAARRIGRAAMGYLARRRKRRANGPYQQIRRIKRKLEKPYKRHAQFIENNSAAPGVLERIQIGANIPQGDTIDSRQAQQICVRSSLIGINVQTTNNGVDSYYRFMLLKARPGSCIDTGNDLSTNLWRLTNSSAGFNFNTAGINQSEQARTNVINHQKWQVLWQKRFLLLRNEADSMGRQYFKKNFLVKYKKELNFYYQGAGSRDFNEVRPAVWLVWFHEHADDTVVDPLISTRESISVTDYFCKNS